ncbi:hypothetical protein D3C80_695600 [compost metagenome]
MVLSTGLLLSSIKAISLFSIPNSGIFNSTPLGNFFLKKLPSLAIASDTFAAAVSTICSAVSTTVSTVGTVAVSGFLLQLLHKKNIASKATAANNRLRSQLELPVGGGVE